MWFSIGAGELVLVAGLALIAAVLAILRLPIWRWAVIGTAGTSVATVLTPADPASTILIAAVFCLFFVSGLRFGRKSPIATA